MEKKLQEITKVKPKSGEDRQAYFMRIIWAIQELPEQTWEDLDAATQKWVNDGAKQHGKKEEIADFPKDASSDDEDDQEADVTKKAKAAKKGGDKKAPKEAAEEKKTKKPAKEAEKKAAKKDEKPAKAAKEKPAKKTKGASSRGSGLEATIKNMIVKKPTISSDELVEKLEAKSVKASRFTVVAIRAGFRHSIKVLQEADLIKGSIEL
jgi:hypothetical protein